MVETGSPENEEGFKKVENQGFTFYVVDELAKELEGHDVELSSIGVLFPRYFISSVREMGEN
ncbi:MAG: hypothetical protein GX046_05435 [Tissierellia bacterium]|nr:hypothetical protein [Tissierellia bacterium]